jgi:hypothetical protein
MFFFKDIKGKNKRKIRNFFWPYFIYKYAVFARIVKTILLLNKGTLRGGGRVSQNSKIYIIFL